MMSVGYDMYLKLLEEAVLESGGETADHIEAECSADLNVPASIPEGYVPSAETRMDLYRRIAAIRDDEEASDLVDEMIDRFGDVPGSVDNLIRIALLRSEAKDCGISEILQKGNTVQIKIAKVNLRAVSGVCANPAFRQALLFHPGDTALLTLRLQNKENVLKRVRQLIDLYRKETEEKIENSGSIEN